MDARSGLASPRGETYASWRIATPFIPACATSRNRASSRTAGKTPCRPAGLLRSRHLLSSRLEPRPQAEFIITNAGLSFEDATGPVKGGFVVKQGTVSGTARRIARAERTRASYDSQHSPDRETSLSLESTAQASPHAYGLVPGKVYFCRYRSLTKAGTGDWSQVVSLLML